MAIKNKFIFILGIVLFAGFFLRLAGIGYGLPYISHPDETRVILDTLSMGQRLSLIPARPDYSLAYRYLLLLIYGVYFMVGRLFGAFRDLNDFAFQFMANPSAVYLISRMVSVILGTATGLLAYLLAKKIFDRATAFAAFIFVLFEFQLLQHAQWAIYPVAFCFTVLLAFYFIFLAIKRPSLKNFVFMGIFTGIAISTQNHGIFLLPSVAIVVWLHLRRNRNILDKDTFIRYWLALILSLAVFSLLGNFYWLFIFKKAAAKYAELLGVTRVGFASQAPFANNIFSMSLWFLKELIRQDGLLGVIAVLGIVYAIYKHSEYDIAFLAYLVTNLLVFSNWGFRLLHDMLGVMPITCIFAARFLADALKKMKFKQAYIYVLSCLVVIPLVCDSIAINNKKHNPDTRQLAREWIEGNISPQDKIAIDWHVFSVPLDSKMPLYFRNPVASKYYEENIPAEIKRSYVQWLKGRRVYEITEAMEPLDEPRWPQDMPEEAVKETERQAVYRDIYSKFHFRSIGELRKDKVQYLIVSSYLYGYFLPDVDLRKKGLFNPFVKDRPWLNFRQADHYINDNRYGLLYFVIRDGRDFYLSFLNNKLKGIVMVKEFSPDERHFGPVIKIYRLQ